MEETMGLAGYFAAHGIWCVSDGDVLIPMIGMETSGERKLVRLVDGDPARVFELAEQQIAAQGPEHAVVIVDARITLPTGKVDALIVDVTKRNEPRARLQIAIPYRPADQGFAVHRPKVIAIEDVAEAAIPELFTAFFRGVDAHEKGAEIWNSALDESI